ncbi:hypothetical protein [Rivihabitans pingtungensis]|uniref:hypothetical protein n=1 Tax=Rivihabitans pingtungensis TaxID=1054498 RepID=UPI0023533D72|nr:hypothetical protein [Rivihabitans pingtungensis]MCK6435956.1 hypothetical protein [Rivihabitans pingtungensis]
MKKKILVGLAGVLGFFIAYFALRNLLGVGLAALVAGLSASAVAAGAAGGAKAGGAAAVVHVPAAVGALAGVLFLAVELRGRPWRERGLLILASYLAAYYGAQAAAEVFVLGAGWVGVSGVVCGRLGVSVLDTAQRLVRDPEFVKGLLSWRSK